MSRAAVNNLCASSVNERQNGFNVTLHIRLVDVAEIVSALQSLGVSGDEAKLYLQLARKGLSTSGEIADATKMNRVTVYRGLLRLRDKGFAESVLGRPIRFAAVPIDEAVDDVARGLRNEVRRVEDMGRSLGTLWDAIRGPSGVEGWAPHRFKLIHGRRNIVRTLERMYDVASEDILFFTTRSGIIRGLKAGEHTLPTYASKGVSIRALGPIDESNFDFARRWTKFAHLRHVNVADYVRFCIVDEKQIMTVLNFADTARLAEDLDVGLWTDSGQFVLAQRTFFRIMWDQSVDFAEREGQLRAMRDRLGKTPEAASK